MYSDLELDPTMPNTELIQDIFISYFHLPDYVLLSYRNLTFCIVIRAENFKIPTVTLTLIAQWPRSKHVRATKTTLNFVFLHLSLSSLRVDNHEYQQNDVFHST